ncbi:hypothetical protein CHF27_012500 [Romboutsia maritimum]|uniref:Uncharacterized protein n=1 Tax=Romboutsia maritimum TaxID=2020948 RepID=A0A371IQ48_9FIRM|nr:hypothetical protein [Romboutsia maritimum]RDY22593.1 hypothetical protein CHF27_012500 [Romboutsia maritimum]
MFEKFKKLNKRMKILVGIIAILAFPFTLIAFGVEFIVNGFKENKIIKIVTGCVLSIAMIGVLYSAGCFDEKQLNEESTQVSAKVDKETDIKNMVTEYKGHLKMLDVTYALGENDTNINLIIKMKFGGTLFDYMAYDDACKIIKSIEEKYPGEIQLYRFMCVADLVDKFGNEEESKVMLFDYTRNNISKVNWDSMEGTLFKGLAEKVWQHDLVEE